MTQSINISRSRSIRNLDNAELKKLVDEPNSSKYVIDAHNRGIEKLVDFSQLPTLHSLDISFNLIESLRNLSTAKGLREIKAYNNRIKSTDHLRENVHLEKVLLTENHIEIISTDFQALTKLKMLYLNRNNITAVQNIMNCRMLLHLDLSYNHLAGAAAEGLNGLMNLISLDLSHNLLIEVGNLSHMGKLQDLNLSNNKLSSLEGLYPPSLQIFRAGGNPIHNLHHLPTMLELEELYIQKALISQTSTLQVLPSCCPKLESLNLSENRISCGNEWTFVKLLTELKDLWIQGNPCSIDENCLRSILVAKPDLRTLNGVKDSDLDNFASKIVDGDLSALVNACNITVDSATSDGINVRASDRIRSRNNEKQHSMGNTGNHSIPVFHQTSNRIGLLEKIQNSDEIVESERKLRKALQHTKALLGSSNDKTRHDKMRLADQGQEYKSRNSNDETLRMNSKCVTNSTQSGISKCNSFSDMGTGTTRGFIAPYPAVQVEKRSTETETSKSLLESVFSFAKPSSSESDTWSQLKALDQAILSRSISNQDMGSVILTDHKTSKESVKQSLIHHFMECPEFMDEGVEYSPRLKMPLYYDKRHLPPPRSRKGFRRFKIPERSNQEIPKQ